MRASRPAVALQRAKAVVSKGFDVLTETFVGLEDGGPALARACVAAQEAMTLVERALAALEAGEAAEPNDGVVLAGSEAAAEPCRAGSQEMPPSQNQSAPSRHGDDAAPERTTKPAAVQQPSPEPSPWALLFPPSQPRSRRKRGFVANPDYWEAPEPPVTSDETVGHGAASSCPGAVVDAPPPDRRGPEPTVAPPVVAARLPMPMNWTPW